jgi:hypothetical protein
MRVVSGAGEPADPMTSLAEGAIQTHELFMAYVNAGFTRSEALRIVIGIVAAHVRPQQ